MHKANGSLQAYKLHIVKSHALPGGNKYIFILHVAHLLLIYSVNTTIKHCHTVSEGLGKHLSSILKGALVDGLYEPTCTLLATPLANHIFATTNQHNVTEPLYD